MIFYGYFRSSAAYRCRIAFHLLNLQPREEYVQLRDGAQQSPEFRQKNPHKLVPVLEAQGEVITQSLAIIEYVNELQNGPLLGNTPIMRAHIRAFAMGIACDIHPLQNLRVLHFIASEYGQTSPEQKSQWARKWIEDGLLACEEIAQKSNSAFIFGDQPSLADICLIPQLYNARRFRVDLDQMPRLCAIDSHCQSLEAFAKAAPEQQPDRE